MSNTRKRVPGHRGPDEGGYPDRWVVGASGPPPSREVGALLASPTLGAMPHGLWHLSDHAADLLAGTVPVITEATHIASGARFRLASVPDGPILAVEAVCKVAQALIIREWDDPTTWANRQSWRIVPADGGEGDGA